MITTLCDECDATFTDLEKKYSSRYSAMNYVIIMMRKVDRTNPDLNILSNSDNIQIK